MTKRTLNNIFFCIGIVAVVAMMLTFDVSFAELWAHLTRAGYWLLPILGIWLIIYAINAAAWRAIIGRGERRLSPWRIYRLTIIGYALNYATPIGGLGGEPYRIAELSKDVGIERATSSVILYSMMHMYAHFWFWFLSIFIYLVLALVGDLPLTTAIGVVLAAIAAFCLLAFYVFSIGYRNGFVRRAISWLGHVPGLKGWSKRFLEQRGEMLATIDRHIATLHSGQRAAFLRSLALEYLGRVVQSLEVLFMLLLFAEGCTGGIGGIGLMFLHSILIVAFTTLFANVLGFLPMQLGVQEGGFVVSIAALGLSPAVGIFVSIICRFREIVWILIGLVMMRIEGHKASATP